MPPVLCMWACLFCKIRCVGGSTDNRFLLRYNNYWVVRLLNNFCFPVSFFNFEPSYNYQVLFM